MAEENKGTGRKASAVPEAESRPYELKQVQVRLRLSEAGSIYSSKEITNDVRAAEVMSDVLAQMDREYVCVVNLEDGSGIYLCRKSGHKKQADQLQHCQHRRHQYGDCAYPEHF